MLCLCSLGGSLSYWYLVLCYSWCELGRRVITSFVCNLIYYTARYLAAAQCIVIGPVCLCVCLSVASEPVEKWDCSTASPSPPFPPLLCREAAPSTQLGGLGERCKLFQWGLGRSPRKLWIWCILRHLVASILMSFLRNYLPNFIHFKRNINHKCNMQSVAKKWDGKMHYEPSHWDTFRRHCCLWRAGSRAVSKPYYSQRACSVCVSVSAFFIYMDVLIVRLR